MKFTLGGYEWELEFVDKDNKELDGAWGICLNGKMKILIRNDLDPQIIKECIIHELCHALLLVQGRGGPQKFNLEDVCEFVGFNGPTLIATADMIYKYYGN